MRLITPQKKIARRCEVKLKILQDAASNPDTAMENMTSRRISKKAYPAIPDVVFDGRRSVCFRARRP